MRLGTSISFAAASLIFAGCFSPGVGVETGTDADVDGSSSGGDTSDTTPATTAEPTGTTASSTSGMTTSSPTTESPTTSMPTTDETTSWDPSDPTSGGEDPFCGDGNIDAGEECDDGLENNGLDQGCLPDCNLNVCGDSNVGPDEFCDDGADDNVLEVGACAPDCSTVVEEKIIQSSSLTAGGNYQPNPVAHADAQCPAGFEALFAVPGVRQATVATAYTADAIIDWPLEPFTAYVRADGTPIWITDDTPLLGVRAGVPQPLTNPVVPVCVVNIPAGQFCFPAVRPTGLNNDWTLALSNSCNGWSSNSQDQTLSFGDIRSSTEFLRGLTTTCATGTGKAGTGGSSPTFYCVEQ